MMLFFYCRELSQCEIFSAVDVAQSGLQVRNITSQAIGLLSIDLFYCTHDHRVIMPMIIMTIIQAVGKYDCYAAGSCHSVRSSLQWMWLSLVWSCATSPPRPLTLPPSTFAAATLAAHHLAAEQRAACTTQVNPVPCVQLNPIAQTNMYDQLMVSKHHI